MGLSLPRGSALGFWLRLTGLLVGAATLAVLARRRERKRADGVRMAHECASDSLIGGKR